MDNTSSVSTVGSRDSGYLFEFRNDGVYLTVYESTEPGIQFELSDMRQILKEFSVDDYNLELLARLVREANGITTKISDKFVVPQNYKEGGRHGNTDVQLTTEELHENREYGNVFVDVSKDKLEVTVRFDIRENQAIPTVDMIKEALAVKNIVFGIDEEAVKEAAASGRITKVAFGIPPEHGLDAQIIKKFDMSITGRPVADEYDRVDYKNLN
ncbi:MAG: DUF342 domain-containing protein, partial [Anaerovibrio sp.]|nr:DUF342 domain-containing protein [Anaerovibrio sp.]